MRILAGGNVGIGTTAPGTSAMLHLSGASKGFAITDTAGSVSFGWAYPNTTTLGFYTGTAATPFTTNLFNITSSGNVGIGTTGPEGKLSVTGDVGIGAIANTDQASHMLDVASTKGSAGFSAIRALYPGGGGLLNTEFGALAHRDSQWNAVYAKQGSAGTALYTDGEVNLMNGNVGIGTTGPGAKLEVAGTLTVSGSNLTSLGGNLTVTGTAWTATPTISGLITATSGLTANGTATFNSNSYFPGSGIWNTSGSVGIGTTAPGTNKLFINATGTDAVMSLDRVSGGDPNDPAIYQQVDAAGSSTGRFLRMDSNNGGDVEFYFDTAGTAKADGSWTGGGADVAEWTPTLDKTLEPADILITDSFSKDSLVRKSGSIPYDSRLVGIVSTNPGLVAGGGEVEETLNNNILVALSGRVPTKVSTINGPIKIGDPITSSEILGVGMRATKAGQIVGKALESYENSDPNAVGKIMVFVNISWYDPDVYLTSAGDLVITGDSPDTYAVATPTGITDKIGAFASATIAKIQAGLTRTNELQVATISPLSPGEPIIISRAQSTIYDLPSTSVDPVLIVDGELTATTISARVAILTDIQANNITAKNIVADTISANHIEGLDAKLATLSAELTDSELTSITDRIKNRLALLTSNEPSAEDIPIPEEATLSASIPTPDYQLPATNLDIDFVTINNYLAVIGSATITDLDVTNHLYVASIDSKTGLLALGDNTLIVDSSGQVAINGNLTVTGKLLADSAEFDTLSLGKLLAIYDESGTKVASIDASGSANLADLTTQMITIASSATASDSSSTIHDLSSTITSNATAGQSTLVSPNTQLTLESPYITSNSLVYLTPTTNTDNKVLFVKSKDDKGFTVAIDTPATTDISFNWWIIQLGAKAPN